MNSKQLFLVVLYTFFIFPANSQTKENGTEFRKFYLSLNAGLDFPLGTSRMVLTDNFTIPFIKREFVPDFKAAWFFSKNYGVGINYHINTKCNKETSYSEYTKQTYEYPVYEYNKISFHEIAHYAGAAFFAKWPLKESRWMILANVGIGYFYNKLSDALLETYYIIDFPDNVLIDISKYPQNVKIGSSDLAGSSIGFSLSSGIRYRVTPLIGIGIDANSLFASVSKMKYKNLFSGEYETLNISRNTNRIGLSGAIDFNF